MEKNQEIRKENLINLYNERGNRHGLWESYWDNGQLYYKGTFVNGNRHGYFEDYYDNGQLKNKTYYI